MNSRSSPQLQCSLEPSTTDLPAGSVNYWMPDSKVCLFIFGWSKAVSSVSSETNRCAQLEAKHRAQVKVPTDTLSQNIYSGI